MTDAELAELLRTVIARPDDHDVLRIYADCLLERGDPRGELIAIQLQRRVDPSEALVARERELAAHLEGALAATLHQPGLVTAWRHGFLDVVDFEPMEGRIALGDSLRGLGTLPEARRLRRIVIRFVEPGWGAAGAIISALTRLAPQFRALCELAFTATGRGQQRSLSPPLRFAGGFGDLSALTRAIPRLEVLELAMADHASLRDARIPNVRRLILEHSMPPPFRSLATQVLAELEIHGLRYFEDLEGLLERDLPLRRLVLVTASTFTMQLICRNLPEASVFRGVDELVLGGTRLDRTCVDYLVHHAAHLRHLRRFEIEGASDLPRLRAAVGGGLVVA